VGMLEAIITGIISAIGGAGLGAWLLNWWKQQHQFHMEDRGDAWTRQAALIDRQDKQIAAIQAEQQRSAVAEMKCREEMARLRAIGQWLYELLRSLHGELERLGAKPDPLPRFPDFTDISAVVTAEREFVQRSLEHSSGLLRQAAKESVKESQPPGGDKP
jgi:hypothetical protein